MTKAVYKNVLGLTKKIDKSENNIIKRFFRMMKKANTKK